MTRPRHAGILFLIVAVVLFYLPGLLPGRVLLPLDILCGVLPWSAMPVCTGQTVSNPVLSDQVFAFHPWRVIQKQDGWPGVVWNRYAFAGSPLLGNGQSAPFFPPNWLLWLLPATWSYVLLAIFKTIVAALFTRAFARRYVSEEAALLAAVSYAFTFTFVFSMGYSFGDVMSWLPALLWAVDRRRWTLTALFTAFELLAGHPETAIVAAFIVGVWFLSTRPPLTDLIRASAAVAVGLLLALPQLVPLLRYVQTSAASFFRGQGFPLIYSAHTLLEFITPEFFGTSSPAHRWASNPGGFFGLASFMLVIVFVIARPGQAVRNPWTWVFVVSLAFIYRVPPLTWLLELPYLRVIFANQFWVATTFAGAMLAAYALDEYTQGRIPRRYVFYLMPGVFTLLMLLALWHFRTFIRVLNLTSFEAGVVLKFALSLAVALAALRWKPAWISAVVYGECVLYLVLYNTAAAKELLYPQPPVVDFLKKDRERFRIMGDGVLPPNTAAIYGLEDLRGYDAITPMRWFRTMERIDPGFPDLLSRVDLSTDAIHMDTLFQRDHFSRMLERWGPGFRDLLHHVHYWNDRVSRVNDPRLLDLMNVKYYLVPHESQPPPGLEDWQRVYSSEVDAYVNPHVYPRAYVVRSGDTDWSSAEIQSYLPNEVVIRADGPGTLVLADAWDPGWRAEGFTIVPYHEVLRSVSLASGSQTVRFHFNPF